jgi:hypothetical protein
MEESGADGTSKAEVEELLSRSWADIRKERLALQTSPLADGYSRNKEATDKTSKEQVRIVKHAPKVGREFPRNILCQQGRGLRLTSRSYGSIACRFSVSEDEHMLAINI